MDMKKRNAAPPPEAEKNGKAIRKEKAFSAFFAILLILQLGILGAVMLLRTARLLFQTTGVFYWKVLYQRGLPPVIAGTVLCLGLTG